VLYFFTILKETGEFSQSKFEKTQSTKKVVKHERRMFHLIKPVDLSASIFFVTRENSYFNDGRTIHVFLK